MAKRAVENVCVGQVDIFSSFSEAFHMLTSEARQDEEPLEEVANASEYLSKGEIIQSLARVKYERELSKISLSDIEEALFSIKITETLSVDPNKAGYDFNQIATAIAKNVIRPCLKAMTKEEDFNPIKTLLHPKFGVSVEFQDDVPCNYCGKREGEVLRCTIYEEGFPPLEFYGLKETAHAKHRKNVSFKNGPLVADIGEVIANLVILSQVMFAYEEADDMQMGKVSEISEKYKEKARLVMNYKNDLSEITCVCASDEAPLFPTSWLTCMQRDGVEIEMVPRGKNYRKLLESTEGVYVRGQRNEGLFAPFYFPETREMCYHSLLAYRGDIKWANVPLSKSNGEYLATHYFADLFVAILEEKFRNVQTRKYFNALKADCAKSYQTKKNIPKKTLEQMEQSGFNRYFGFVEYDESVDLAKASEIEKEFIAFKETYLPDVDSTDNAIRFRLLGNHKATGLYYPYIGCLCVDVRNPSSLVHEYGHLIDYKYGSLSRTYAFAKVRDMYEKRLRAEAENNSLANGQLKSKSKYNLDYFLIPTEIFARSFEIYLSKVLGMKNSLVPQEFNWAYPLDDEFVLAVTKYFENSCLFSR